MTEPEWTLEARRPVHVSDHVDTYYVFYQHQEVGWVSITPAGHWQATLGDTWRPPQVDLGIFDDRIDAIAAIRSAYTAGQ